MLSSKLQHYSMGVVLEDKEPDSDILIVQPTEALTNKSGDLTVYEHKHGEIIGNNRIECIWLNYSDIRDTAPDMVIGEKVQIIRYAHTDMYYWYSFGRSNDLRRLEHVQWQLSNTPGVDERPTPSNQLFFIASTREGYIQVVTPDNNGEKSKLEFKANFKDGEITFEDGGGGTWSWNTVSGKIRFKMKEVYWDVPKIVFNGKLIVKRGFSVMGVSKMFSNLTVRGKVKVHGAVKVFGIIYAYLFKHL